MQLFHCPFCGPRAESEFHYGGEAGNVRPGKDGPVSDETWVSYLYMRDNPKGRTREIWMHRTCGELFEMTRDTVTHVAEATTALGGETSR
jgi:sarcosine oxidase, subunit delta